MTMDDRRRMTSPRDLPSVVCSQLCSRQSPGQLVCNERVGAGDVGADFARAIVAYAAARAI